jgi:4-hydroxy-tetrahydrodipicolinate reductase
MATKVVVVGAGPIGLGVAREVASRPGLVVHGVVDIDPQKAGMIVEGARVTREIPEGADVALVCTTSSLAKLEPQLAALLGKRLPVVSTCEELAWPHTQPEIAQRIDAAARAAGVAVLGTGVNPGFLMDALPLALTAPCRRVERVRVERVQDASTRRQPFQDKVGVGLVPADVEREVRAGRSGHVGLRESAHMLATRLGFVLDGYREDVRVVVADRAVEANGRRVEVGQGLGVEQVGTGTSSGVVRVELFFRATFGQEEPRDRVIVEGEPRLDVTIAGGVPGDVATCAIVVNAIPSVRTARPGLVTMADLAVAWHSSF